MMTRIKFINQVMSNISKSQYRSLQYAKRQCKYLLLLKDNYLIYKYHKLPSDDTLYNHLINKDYNKYQHLFNYQREPSYIIMLDKQLKHNFNEYSLNTLVMAYKVRVSNIKGKIADCIIEQDKGVQADFRHIYHIKGYKSLLHFITTLNLTLDEKAFLQTTVSKLKRKHKSLTEIKIMICQEYKIMIKSEIKYHL